ncbi:hydroxymethylglutaryl-CoA lyase [Bordetella sp. 02P26C-1]|uniref:hydroxymethylglutaryl-CoA lyase n=1 Tax=unclassified Bordetella TaxID=2630031 RepID=UPI0013243F9A|nr:hydroxymethylglutaryl-CoA lyase [Bordetella sp. 15P40C-2]MVW80624.1 hydroxymethylglutaryl-CoA lyase [Bordetella sp. 02P26C-1]
MTLPDKVDIVEVGLRDGLQSEPEFVPTETKVEMLNALIDAGVRHFEATSFVSPRAVPQLRDAQEVLAGVHKRPGVVLAALAPNRKGVERALQSQADEVVVFVSASQTHNQKNLNRPIEKSLQDIEEIAELLGDQPMKRKGAIAVAFGCPFEGDVDLATLKTIFRQFHRLGFDGVTLGDTTGMATPALVRRTVEALRAEAPDMNISLHFHNTRGIGLVNVVEGLRAGITSYESSLGGLGGCPFAPGATGNICTEDLVYLLDEMGIDSGIDLRALIDVAQRLERVIGRKLPGQLMKAGPRLRLYDVEAVVSAVG